MTTVLHINAAKSTPDSLRRAARLAMAAGDNLNVAHAFRNRTGRHYAQAMQDAEAALREALAILDPADTTADLEMAA